MLPARFLTAILLAGFGAAQAAEPVLINPLTPAYKGESTTAPAFPDVTKVPAPPGGPVPIPYPNIGKPAEGKKGGPEMGPRKGAKKPDLAPTRKSTMTPSPGVPKNVISPPKVTAPVRAPMSAGSRNAPPGTQLAPSQTKIKVSP